jgi:dTDP-4-dehydrorhamnose reductase
VRVLITGAGGQLGVALQRELSGHEALPFDHQGLDVADRQAVRRALLDARPEWLINCAAFNDVDGAESNVEAAFRANADGPESLAGAAAELGVRMVHISTDYVFDGKKGSPYTEDDAPNPLSAYARSKLEGERRVLESGARACVLRTAWLYSARPGNFVTTIFRAALKGGPLRVVADQVGSPTSCADLARAIAGLLRRPQTGLFHVVNAGACSRYEFAKAIVRGRVEVQPISTAEAARPAPRPAFSALISTRWEGVGFTPLRPWQEALDEVLDQIEAARPA